MPFLVFWGLGRVGTRFPVPASLISAAWEQRYRTSETRGETSLESRSNTPSGVCTLAGKCRAASFKMASTPSATPPLPRWIGMTISSPVVHVTFEVGEEPVESCSLPDLLRGRDVDAPLREMEQDFGGDVAGDRGTPKGVEGRGVESVDPLGDPPGCQSAQ